MDKGITSSNSITPEDLVAQLRALQAQIPEYTQTPAHPTAVLANIGKLDPQFISTATSAIGTSEDLQKAVGATPELCVQEANDANRWAQVEDEVFALYLGIRNANLTRKHRIGLRALRAYQMTKQFVRVEGNDALKPHLAEMRRFNRLGKGRRNAGSQQPAPQQQTVIGNDAV